MSSNDRSEPTPGQRRNRRLAILCAAGFFGMVGLAYASVPLYRAFCQLTGFDGTVRRADKAPDEVLGKTLSVRFDTNVNGLPWDFKAQQVRQTTRIGETKLALFKVTNNSDRPITGRAVFNVVPEEAGAHFQKLECFCFTEQTIGPGKSVEFPMLYFVDPAYATDAETRGEREVTLSYTFFPATPEKAAGQQAQVASPAAASALGVTPRAGL